MNLLCLSLSLFRPSRRECAYFLVHFLSWDSLSPQSLHCFLSSQIPSFSLGSPHLCVHYETGSPTHPAWSMEQTQPHWWWQTHYHDCISQGPWCREGPHRARRWMSGMKLNGTHRSSQGDGCKFLLGLCYPCGIQWGPIIVNISLHENDSTIPLYI